MRCRRDIVCASASAAIAANRLSRSSAVNFGLEDVRRENESYVRRSRFSPRRGGVAGERHLERRREYPLCRRRGGDEDGERLREPCREYVRRRGGVVDGERLRERRREYTCRRRRRGGVVDGERLLE